MSKLINLGGAAFGYLCAATAIAQIVILYSLWQRGVFSPAKRDKIAAIAFGLDISHWEPAAPPVANAPPRSEKEKFQQQVKNDSILEERRRATSRAIETLRGSTDLFKIDRTRYDALRKSFADDLKQREEQVRIDSIADLRTTFEVLPAKQSKDLILEMLRDDQDGDAMTDLLEVIKAMPLDRSKKIFAEFKSDEEAKTLHMILVELGDLARRVAPTKRR